MRCPRCHLPNSAGVAHNFAGEPCSGIARKQIDYREEERRYREGRDDDGLDRFSVADDLRAQGAL